MKDITAMRVFYATIVGLIVGGVISSVTEYYTGLGKKPILNIVEKSATGAGTNIIAGLSNRYDFYFPYSYFICSWQYGLLMHLQVFMVLLWLPQQ